MSNASGGASLDFNVLPIAQACTLLQRVGRALALAVLAPHPLAPVTTFLARGEEQLLAPAPPRDLRRHRRATGHERYWWRLHKRPHPPELRKIGAAWRDGSVSPLVSQLHVLERIEKGYQGLTAHHLPEQFWQLAGIRAWGDLAYQQELAHACRAALCDRVLFTAAEMGVFYPRTGPVELLSPQVFWLLTAVADTCPEGALWWPSQRRCRQAAAQLQEIGEKLACTAQWASLWDQWFILELASQDSAAFANLTPQLQAAITELPIFRVLPEYKPPLPIGPNLPQAPQLASWQGTVPEWMQRYYSQERK